MKKHRSIRESIILDHIHRKVSYMLNFSATLYSPLFVGVWPLSGLGVQLLPPEIRHQTDPPRTHTEYPLRMISLNMVVKMHHCMRTSPRRRSPTKLFTPVGDRQVSTSNDSSKIELLEWGGEMEINSEPLLHIFRAMRES